MKTKIQMKMSYIMIILLSIFFSTSLQAQICPDGMTHYWKLDEGSSSTYSDLYGLNATCSNCPSPVSGVINNAQQFAQSTAVNVPSHNSFDWTGSFSIEFWMKTDPSSTCSGNQVVIGRDDPSTPLHWWTGCKDGGQAAFYLGDNSGNGAYLNGTTDITDGNWHHIVAIRDASNNEISLYVDGVKEASTTKTFGDFVSTSPINIGWLNLSTGYHFIGSVDELAVYNRVLSNAEIQQHYQQSGYCVITHTITATAGSGGSISPSGTVTVVQGADQIFTIMPDSGYHISDVKIDGVSIGPVPSYKFTNVIGDHTISAYFSINQGSLQGFVYDALFPNKPIVNAKIDLASSYTEYSDSTGFYRFLNLPAGTYDITASALRYTPGIINGITVTDGGTTIQDIALTCNVSFTDIPSGYWAEDYIKSMYCKEITNGCSTNPLMYCPENTVSRASLAVFIIRAMGESPSSAPYNAYFDDIANDWFAPYINRLWELGITAGCGPRLFCPSNVVRRAPLAVLIIKAF